ncbi:MAG: hypothetical protein ACE5G0_08075 [Rhodothermales bacterium]
MLHALRTYRVLHVLVTAALLFSVSLPLVQYTCEISGEAMPALATSASGMTNHASHGMACCHGVPSHVTDVLCAHMACCRSEAAHEAPMPHSGETPGVSQESCASCSGCFSEAMLTQEAFLPGTKVFTTYSLLPAVAVLTSTPEEAPRFISLSQRHRADWPPGPPQPLRVLFSSYLL